jgi:hypothetical protein
MNRQKDLFPVKNKRLPMKNRFIIEEACEVSQEDFDKLCMNINELKKALFTKEGNDSLIPQSFLDGDIE